MYLVLLSTWSLDFILEIGKYLVLNAENLVLTDACLGMMYQSAVACDFATLFVSFHKLNKKLHLNVRGFLFVLGLKT